MRRDRKWLTLEGVKHRLKNITPINPVALARSRSAPPSMLASNVETQRLSDIERTRKLFGLDPSQHHHAGARALNHAREASRADARVRLVVNVDFKFNVRSENSAFRAILCQSIERSE